MLFESLRQKYGKRLLSAPVLARHCEHSMVFSADDEPGRPSQRLLSVALAAIQAATTLSLDDIAGRIQGQPVWTDVFPGEHYKLLAGMVQSLQPRTVIEIGTGGGLSALALRKFLPEGGKLVTYDLVAWKDFGRTHLRGDDFDSDRFVQHVDDLATPAGLGRHRALLETADLLFIDAAKDGVMEQRLLDGFQSLKFAHPPLLLFDDIRLWNMLGIWRRISMPKLDLTSFGHWSGTGLLEWQGRS